MVRVRSWVESAAGTQITVLLEDVKTGLPIATNTVAGESFNEAASMVAGYIARQIFAMDRTVPEWCYGTADGRDLGAMQLARLKRVYAACPRDIASSRERPDRHPQQLDGDRPDRGNRPVRAGSAPGLATTRTWNPSACTL